MSLIDHMMQPHAREEAKIYLAQKEIPQLMESLTAGLLHHRPVDPIEFVQNCLALVRNHPKMQVKWNTFIDWEPNSKPQEDNTQEPPTEEHRHDHHHHGIASS